MLLIFTSVVLLGVFCPEVGGNISSLSLRGILCILSSIAQYVDEQKGEKYLFSCYSLGPYLYIQYFPLILKCGGTLMYLKIIIKDKFEW